MSTNPFAPPGSDPTRVALDKSAPPLWNPNAAACWSIVLTPVFGAYIHMRNWQALGEKAKAAESRTWMIMTIIGHLAAFAASLIFYSSALSSVPRAAGLAMLICWYLFGAKPQVKYIGERFGDSFPRKGWVKVLVIWTLGILALGIAILAALFAVIVQGLAHGNYR